MKIENMGSRKIINSNDRVNDELICIKSFSFCMEFKHTPPSCFSTANFLGLYLIKIQFMSKCFKYSYFTDLY